MVRYKNDIVIPLFFSLTWQLNISDINQKIPALKLIIGVCLRPFYLSLGP